MICARYHGWSFITRLALCLALVISPMTTTAAPMPSFTPIPLVPAGSANAISADGSTVVGTALGSVWGARPAPFRWTAAGGTEFLGQPIWSGDARSVSGDGSVIAGKDLATTSEMIGNFRWNAVEGFVALSPVHRSESNGVSVSTDGSVIVGTQTVGNVQAGGYEEAFRWTPQHGVVSLPSLPGASGTQRGWAFAVSDEGTIVGASSESDLWPHIAVRWSADGTISRLFDDGIAAISAATDITPDGSVIVGNGPGAFRWTQAGGVQPLGGFEDVYDTKRATGVSADGSVIVGGADGDVSGQNSFEAFIWDPLHGARRLETVLTGLGVDLQGWELTEATGISADGLTIVGVGLAPGATRFQPWVVTIPEPAALAPVLLLVLLVARRRAA